MSKNKPYKVVVKVMKKDGWEKDHTSDSHEIYVKDGFPSCPVKCTKRHSIRNIDEHREDNRAKILALYP
ncbi:hypothetical protein [Enterococcus nangangensis]|uniref:hypothetical protein n=1 Tax=Enterococcus nangangensis TaxID=2559926 RepID=UPI001FEA5057|nr:hypothetical protein [Enterococcus nangangensis]